MDMKNTTDTKKNTAKRAVQITTRNLATRRERVIKLLNDALM
jgi:hypothetical protein